MSRQEIKENKRNERNYTRGITLVALVITIVILIILATVTVNVAFGDGGLIDQAKLAAEKTANSIYDEEASIANLTAYLNEELGGGEILPPEDTEPPVISSFIETEVTENSITVSTTATDNSGGTLKYEYRKGSEAFTEGGTTYQFTGLTADTEYTLEVKVTDEAELSDTATIKVSTKRILASDGSFDAEKGVNTPNIGANMELVVFDEGTSEWIKDETNSGYSYIDTSESGKENKSEWANAKVTISGVDSYFVWIPRYAYKINGENDIDIVFINGTGTEAADGITTCKYADDPTLNTSTDYIIHPAFTTNADLGGGWDEELSGIWIGKYETSSVEGNSNSSSGDNVTTKRVKVQPGVSSWRYIQIGNMYTVSQNYAPDLKSHMLKNSEWGAVAYLTESEYGRNGEEVSINNNGTTYYTGGGTENAYTTAENVLQSSTGNVYGIYDLSGNANEYVASYFNGIFTNRDRIGYGSSFASIGGKSNKYSTAYTGEDETAYKYGDATHETSGWNDDSNYFAYAEAPFFGRGIFYDSASGVFCFSSESRLLHGGYFISYSFMYMKIFKNANYAYFTEIIAFIYIKFHEPLCQNKNDSILYKIENIGRFKRIVRNVSINFHFLCSLTPLVVVFQNLLLIQL